MVLDSQSLMMIVDEYHGINQYQQTDQCLVNDIILFDVIH